jgi:hypothetical protein
MSEFGNPGFGNWNGKKWNPGFGYLKLFLIKKLK